MELSVAKRHGLIEAAGHRQGVDRGVVLSVAKRHGLIEARPGGSILALCKRRYPWQNATASLKQSRALSSIDAWPRYPWQNATASLKPLVLGRATHCIRRYPWQNATASLKQAALFCLCLAVQLLSVAKRHGLIEA